MREMKGVRSYLGELAEREGDTDGFDPVRDLFVAQFARPAQLVEINLRTLSPFQRALLVIDGTVTKFIEAYMMEPVEIRRLSQAQRSLLYDHKWLDARQGMSVVAREVLLVGRRSRQMYAYAASILVPERLPAVVRRGLDSAGQGLGSVLLDSRLETRREVLWYGRVRLEALPEAIHHLEGEDFISRTYRIIVGGKPVMIIKENFPHSSERLPAHH